MASMRRYEHKLATQRKSDDYVSDLSHKLASDKMLRENFASDDRVENLRYIKESRAAMREQYASEELAKAAASKQRERILREQDERLAVELARRKTEQSRELKNVQRVCEQSEELRELEAKLKAAYMNKEREAQVIESAGLIQKEAVKQSEMDAEMEKARQKGLQAEAYREYLRARDGRSMRMALDKQIEEKKEASAAAYAEYLKEKSMVDKVVEAIYEEDEAERLARNQKIAETRAYIDAFIMEQEQLKKTRQEQIEAENEEIRKYAEEVMEREAKARVERQREQDTKDAVLEKLSNDMAKRQREIDEMENLRNELVLQEQEEKIILKEKEKLARAVQQRLDIALANEYQKQLKAIRREEEKKEEDAFRAAMFEKFAEDDRIDQLNAQKRRMKQMEHRKEIERLLEERRSQYEAERAAELQVQMDEERVSQLRAQIIEEERQRLLAAHAVNLGVRHLPKGVLATEDDLKFFKP